MTSSSASRGWTSSTAATATTSRSRAEPRRRGDDIIIGGLLSSSYYNETSSTVSLVALGAIRDEWTRTDLGFADRIDHLDGTTAGGLNVAFLLKTGTGATVLNEGPSTTDMLSGSVDLDWFFARTDGAGADVIADALQPEESAELRAL
jgi:hypothetical protein